MSMMGSVIEALGCTLPRNQCFRTSLALWQGLTDFEEHGTRLTPGTDEYQIKVRHEGTLPESNAQCDQPTCILHD